MTKFVKEATEARLNEGPSALVFGLFLDPFHLSITVTLKRGLDRAEWEWSQLFNTDDCNIFNFSFSAFLLKIKIDLSTAIENLFYQVIADEITCWVLKDSLEPKPCPKIFNFAGRSFILEQLFRDGHDQRLSEWPSNLTSQEVEILGGGCAIIERKVHILRDHGVCHIIC